MIELHFGKIGSGKTLGMVIEIVENLDGKHTFSNINMPGIKNNTAIKPYMIAKRVTIEEKGKEKEVLQVNVDFWKEQVKKYGSLNIVIDEAHNLLNARRGQSEKSVIFLSFIALLRRAIGSKGERAGKLVLISQQSRKLDVLARESATRIKYYRANYLIDCLKCKTRYTENNETPEKVLFCLNCGSTKLKQHTFLIEVYSFTDIEKFERFEAYREKTYYSHKIISRGEKFFKYYNTYEWGSLLDEM